MWVWVVKALVALQVLVILTAAVYGGRHGGLHHVLLQALSCDDREQRPAGSDGQSCSTGSCAAVIVLLFVLLIILVVKQRQSRQQCTGGWRQQLHPPPAGQAGRAGKHIMLWYCRQRCGGGAARAAGSGAAGGEPLRRGLVLCAVAKSPAAHSSRAGSRSTRLSPSVLASPSVQRFLLLVDAMDRPLLLSNERQKQWRRNRA